MDALFIMKQYLSILVFFLGFTLIVGSSSQDEAGYNYEVPDNPLVIQRGSASESQVSILISIHNIYHVHSRSQSEPLERAKHAEVASCLKSQIILGS